MNTITQDQVIDQVAERSGHDSKVTAEVLKAFEHTILATVAGGQVVSLSNAAFQAAGGAVAAAVGAPAAVAVAVTPAMAPSVQPGEMIAEVADAPLVPSATTDEALLDQLPTAAVTVLAGVNSGAPVALLDVLSSETRYQLESSGLVDLGSEPARLTAEGRRLAGIASRRTLPST